MADGETPEARREVAQPVVGTIVHTGGGAQCFAAMVIDVFGPNTSLVEWDDMGGQNYIGSAVHRDMIHPNWKDQPEWHYMSECKR